MEEAFGVAKGEASGVPPTMQQKQAEAGAVGRDAKDGAADDCAAALDGGGEGDAGEPGQLLPAAALRIEQDGGEVRFGVGVFPVEVVEDDSHADEPLGKLIRRLQAGQRGVEGVGRAGPEAGRLLDGDGLEAERAEAAGVARGEDAGGLVKREGQEESEVDGGDEGEREQALADAAPLAARGRKRGAGDADEEPKGGGEKEPVGGGVQGKGVPFGERGFST